MIQEEKRQLRAETRATLVALSRARFAEAGHAVLGPVSDTDAFRNARIVLAFLPMPREIDTVPLIDASLAAGKTVGVPRIEGDDIAFVALDPAWRAWPRDRFGIPEPPADAVRLEAAELAAGPTLVLAPGLAFDRSGGRLGRGKGYYDRFLAALDGFRPEPGALSVAGVCLREQLVDRVPADGRDRRVDAVFAG